VDGEPKRPPIGLRRRLPSIWKPTNCLSSLDAGDLKAVQVRGAVDDNEWDMQTEMRLSCQLAHPEKVTFDKMYQLGHQVRLRTKQPKSSRRVRSFDFDCYPGSLAAWDGCLRYRARMSAQGQDESGAFPRCADP
jgi:hypothetical protein